MVPVSDALTGRGIEFSLQESVQQENEEEEEVRKKDKKKSTKKWKKNHQSIAFLTLQHT